MESAHSPGTPEAASRVTRIAPAKLNLGLEVLGRRANGYHELISVMQAIDLADTLYFWPAAELSLTCSAPYLASEDNLVLKAARLLAEATGITPRARIHLQKRIPVAAGLGGGSSDAAAALLGLAELWEARPSHGQMSKLALRLGADVPFFLEDGTALVEGIGDRITAVRRLATHWVVLVVPQLQLPHKTATLYSRLQPFHFSGGSSTRAILRSIENGEPLQPDLLVNTFERVLSEEPVQQARQMLLAAGAPWVRLSGSGPSLFCLFADEAEAHQVYDRLPRSGLERYLARTL